MTTHRSNGDNRDLIAQWVEEHPELWGEGTTPLSTDFVDRVVADIVSGERMARHRQLDSKRRRRAVGGGLLAAALMAGSAVGVAALIRLAQPSQPAAGIACRSGISADADTIVIEPTTDVLAGCRQLWADGAFGDAPMALDKVPPLVACISATGVTEVYPGTIGTCTSLGLVDADPVPDASVELLLTLQERVVAEINATQCMSASEADVLARRIIDEVGAVGWTVETRPDSVDAPCVKAAVLVAERVVLIVKFP